MECPQCKSYNSTQATQCTTCGSPLSRPSAASGAGSPVTGFRTIGSTTRSQAQPPQSSYTSPISDDQTYAGAPNSYSSYDNQNPPSGSYSQPVGQSSPSNYNTPPGYQSSAYSQPTGQADPWNSHAPLTQSQPDSFQDSDGYAKTDGGFGGGGYSQSSGGYAGSNYDQNYGSYGGASYGPTQGGVGAGTTGYSNCPNCRAMVPSTAANCFSCGMPMMMAGMYSDKDKTTALLLCLLTGGVGGHQFYVGNNGKGLLYLFTAGLLGIGAIMDLINIINGTFTDSLGRRLRQS